MTSIIVLAWEDTGSVLKIATSGLCKAGWMCLSSAHVQTLAELPHIFVLLWDEVNAVALPVSILRTDPERPFKSLELAPKVSVDIFL
jgi:hypothetical protein